MSNIDRVNGNGIRDFTDRTHLKSRSFQIDDDIFECARVLPAGVGRAMAQLTKMTPADQFQAIGDILEMILLPDSAARFAERMMSPTQPISVPQIGDIIEWLTEEYGGRPTVPSSPLTPPSTPIDLSSTDGVPVEVSNL